MTYICGYVLSFSDDGEPEEQVLQRGTLEECQYVADNIPAVAYSGDRPNPVAHFVIVEET